MSILAFIIGGAVGGLAARAGRVLATAFIVALLVVACAGAQKAQQLMQGTTTSSIPREAGTVARVVDGDTVKVRLDDRIDTIRMLGVDTPESVPPRPPECFGKQAAAHTRELLPVGAHVQLRFEHLKDGAPERDRYGRLLAHITVRTARGGSIFVGRNLVAGGYAEAYDPGSRYASRLYVDTFDRLEVRARRLKLGQWGAC